jgi:hypothetical protein
MAGTVEKAQKIAAEVVGQARGTTATLKKSIKDWFAEAESMITKNPLLTVTVAGAVGFALATKLTRKHWIGPRGAAPKLRLWCDPTGLTAPLPARGLSLPVADKLMLGWQAQDDAQATWFGFTLFSRSRRIRLKAQLYRHAQISFDGGGGKAVGGSVGYDFGYALGLPGSGIGIWDTSAGTLSTGLGIPLGTSSTPGRSIV